MEKYFKKIYSALTDGDIITELPKCKIIKYEELRDFKTINKLLPQKTDYCILLFEQINNFGHWIAIFKRDNLIYFFDPLGYRIDKQLLWNDYYLNKQLGQEIPFLSYLFNKSVDDGFTVYFNEYKFQDETTNSQTCGRWCVLFIKYMLSNKNNNITTFYNYIKEQLKRYTIIDKDLLVCMLIDI
jgi:hypothetical protein